MSEVKTPVWSPKSESFTRWIASSIVLNRKATTRGANASDEQARAVTGTSVMIARKSDSGPVSRLKQALTTGKFVMIAHGSACEATHAREIINYSNPEALEEHQPSHNSLEPSLVGA